MEIGFFQFLISWKCGRRAGGGGRAAPGGCVVLPWIIFGTWLLEFLDILEILDIYIFSWFLQFFQKRRAPKFHADWSDFRGEISHMRPIQTRKLKLFQTPISNWRRRRRRRRRRRPNNSPIWPEPWTITPRDQISRSGSIPHFDEGPHRGWKWAAKQKKCSLDLYTYTSIHLYSNCWTNPIWGFGDLWNVCWVI